MILHGGEEEEDEVSPLPYTLHYEQLVILQICRYSTPDGRDEANDKTISQHGNLIDSQGHCVYTYTYPACIVYDQ